MEKTMNTKHEFGEIQRKNMEAAMRLAQISIDNSQRIMALQSQLARELFENSVDQAKAQASSKDPQDIVSLRARYAQETTQKMIAAAQQVADIGNNARLGFRACSPSSSRPAARTSSMPSSLSSKRCLGRIPISSKRCSRR